jgi:hypothetical protein
MLLLNWKTALATVLCASRLNRSIPQLTWVEVGSPSPDLFRRSQRKLHSVSVQRCAPSNHAVGQYVPKHDHDIEAITNT